jgi:hypothetical protein
MTDISGQPVSPIFKGQAPKNRLFYVMSRNSKGFESRKQNSPYGEATVCHIQRIKRCMSFNSLDVTDSIYFEDRGNVSR